MTSTELYRCIPPLVRGPRIRKARRSEKKEREAHGASLKCVVVVLFFPPSPQFSLYVSQSPAHAVKKKTTHTARVRVPLSVCTVSRLLQREWKCPGRSPVDAALSCTAMPIQRLPLCVPQLISCPLPSPHFQGGVPELSCQHVMSLPIVGRNDWLDETIKNAGLVIRDT